MATVEQNLTYWNAEHDWREQGDEWSSPWGGTDAQWWGTLLPRVHAFLPAATILEIAPGFGRWTQYLKERCERLILVDLAAKCIEACQRRFAADTHITYHVNDGTSLEMIADRSIDFAFSFDSLVHAEAHVLEAYVHQLARKLLPDGVAFIHHSNVAAYEPYASWSRKLPRGRGVLARMLLLQSVHYRATSMSAALFRRYADASGLACIGQELINWKGSRLIDCLSLCTPRGSRWTRKNRVVRNRRFMDEAASVARLSRLYAPDSFGSHSFGGAS